MSLVNTVTPTPPSLSGRGTLSPFSGLSPLQDFHSPLSLLLSPSSDVSRVGARGGEQGRSPFAGTQYHFCVLSFSHLSLFLCFLPLRKTCRVWKQRTKTWLPQIKISCLLYCVICLCWALGTPCWELASLALVWTIAVSSTSRLVWQSLHCLDQRRTCKQKPGRRN